MSAEVEPFAKVGGLADVAGSLPPALEALGHDAKIVMPAYAMIVNDPRWGARKVVSQLPVKVNEKVVILADLYEIEHEGLHVWLIDGDHFFNRVSKSEEVYTCGREAYLFFSQAVIEVCNQQNWIPDIVHANDWHMAFTPVFVREKSGWGTTASVYTIHNLAYQGTFGSDTIEAAGLDWSLYNMHQLETWGTVNFLKSGCVFAEQVNTVSPTYAGEIQGQEFGCGLQGLMAHLWNEGRLKGILNGIDVVHHDPMHDPRIPFHFDADNLDGKKKCREALCNELGLDFTDETPVIGVVSRLSNQKGFDLIVEAFDKIIDLDCRVVILATGDPWAAGELRKAEAKYPGKFKFVEAYDAELAQRIYAGIDVFLMPSAFEPCGLGQMFALRYGSVPVVRKTGGLADTVFEGQNGFVFENRNAFDMYGAIRRAVEAFRTEKWVEVVKTGMNEDFSWKKSALKYESMYKEALDSLKMASESAEA